MNRELFNTALGQMDAPQPAEKMQKIGKEQLDEAIATLQEYKSGKSNLEKRIIEDEQWWKIRHWEQIKKAGSTEPDAASAYLFNTITNKHADAMDNFPEPVVLPREQSDEAAARTLTSVLPVILESNDFDDCYSRNWYEKLKHGTAVYGVFWDSSKENGLGDIVIKDIDLLNIFYESGITDIQQSKNLFITDLWDTDTLDATYPEHKGKWSSAIQRAEYLYDDTVDTTKKVCVVDWYYKVKSPTGKTVLHYAKFVGDILLYASENEPEYQETGWYGDGQYPVVFDTLFPEKGTPVGFGYVAVCKRPQLYIDKLSANVLETSTMASKRRWFVSETTNINVDDYANWNNPFVRVAGSLEDVRIRSIDVNPIDPATLNVIQTKVEEMKDTASNRDVNSGGTGSGVTAAAAIAALQEAGNKLSRDMISASYRAYNKVDKMVIERMRQFYDTMRSFRITGDAGQYEFVTFDNGGIADQAMPGNVPGEMLYRHPIFDLKIKAQKKSPFSRMEQNERAKEFYSMGFFEPANAQQSLTCLEMMDFEGIEQMKQKISQGQTLLNMLQQMQLENAQLKMALGLNPALEPGMMPGGPMNPSGGEVPSNPLASGLTEAQASMTPYANRLAERAKPNLEITPAGTQI